MSKRKIRRLLRQPPSELRKLADAEKERICQEILLKKTPRFPGEEKYRIALELFHLGIKTESYQLLARARSFMEQALNTGFSKAGEWLEKYSKECDPPSREEENLSYEEFFLRKMNPRDIENAFRIGKKFFRKVREKKNPFLLRRAKELLNEAASHGHTQAKDLLDAIGTWEKESAASLFLLKEPLPAETQNPDVADRLFWKALDVYHLAKEEGGHSDLMRKVMNAIARAEELGSEAAAVWRKNWAEGCSKKIADPAGRGPSGKQIHEAMQMATFNRKHLDKSFLCGCYYCINIYPAIFIVAWTDDEKTALCPKCGVDSVIP